MIFIHCEDFNKEIEYIDYYKIEIPCFPDLDGQWSILIIVFFAFFTPVLFGIFCEELKNGSKANKQIKSLEEVQVYQLKYSYKLIISALIASCFYSIIDLLLIKYSLDFIVKNFIKYFIINFTIIFSIFTLGGILFPFPFFKVDNLNTNLKVFIECEVLFKSAVAIDDQDVYSQIDKEVKKNTMIKQKINFYDHPEVKNKKIEDQVTFFNKQFGSFFFYIKEKILDSPISIVIVMFSFILAFTIYFFLNNITSSKILITSLLILFLILLIIHLIMYFDMNNKFISY